MTKKELVEKAKDDFRNACEGKVRAIKQHQTSGADVEYWRGYMMGVYNVLYEAGELKAAHRIVKEVEEDFSSPGILIECL